MNKNKVFKVMSMLLAATIGAGFASGREAMTFFRDYNILNFGFMLLTFLGLFFMAYVFSRIGNLVKATNVFDVTKAVFKKAAPVMNVLIPFGLFGTLFSMIAGLDSLAISIIPNYSYSFPWLSIVISVVVIAIVSGGLKSVLKATSMIMPIIIAIVLVTASYFLIFAPHGVVAYNNTLTVGHAAFGLVSTLFYIGNNLTTGGVILVQLDGVLDKKQSKLVSFGFALFFTVSASLVILTLFLSNTAIFIADMPMIEIANSISPILGVVYATILFFAISMTLTACAFALTNWFNKKFKNEFYSVTCFVGVGWLLSRFGFGEILDVIYPIKGAIGFVFALGVLVYYLRHRKQIDKADETKHKQEQAEQLQKIQEEIVVEDVPLEIEENKK